MPLLDSFRVDHTKMSAPAVRLAKVMETKHKDKISVFDLRFCKPNKEIMSEKGIHTMEHMFAGFMRAHLQVLEDVEIIDISPMGCRTGFYMSVSGLPSLESVKKAWELSMQDIVNYQKESIPEANEYQCGTYKMHSIIEAKEIARDILQKGIGIMDNNELLLSQEKLKELEG